MPSRFDSSLHPLLGDNEALIAFLAQRLGVRKSQMEIVAGATSRRKMIGVIGLSAQKVEERLVECSSRYRST